VEKRDTVIIVKNYGVPLVLICLHTAMWLVEILKISSLLILISLKSLKSDG